MAWQRLEVKQSILKKKIIKIFKNHNLISSHALICANALINAELVGAPSHGLSRLKMYCDIIESGGPPIVRTASHNGTGIMIQKHIRKYHRSYL